MEKAVPITLHGVEIRERGEREMEKTGVGKGGK